MCKVVNPSFITVKLDVLPQFNGHKITDYFSDDSSAQLSGLCMVQFVRNPQISHVKQQG